VRNETLSCPSRGFREHRVERHRRRCRSDRHEVTVPYRVFPASEVDGELGSRLPVRPWHSQTPEPSGISSSDRAQRCDSLGIPLLGFSPSTRCCPTSPPPVSRQMAPLLGFRAPSTLEEERVHVPNPVARWAPRFCRGVGRRFPGRRLRCRSQVFPTSQRLLPLPALPPFSDGWRSWGSPFRGLILSRSPSDFRRWHTLLTFLPRVAQPPS
jgi:hypothetical protein